MTKSELINAVNAAAAEQDIELTKKDTRVLIDLLFETVAGAIKEDDRFSYPNFGTFSVKSRKARTGRNPQTGEEIQIPASKSVSFRPSPKLREMVNE